MEIKSEDILSIRKARGWSQYDLANYLRVRQPTVARMEKGQKPNGPISKLLEELKAEPVPAE